MPDLRTLRLCLHLIDGVEGERFVARTPGPDDAWAEHFPSDGDVVAVEAFLSKGQPQGGCVEIGHGLAPSAAGTVPPRRG